MGLGAGKLKEVHVQQKARCDVGVTAASWDIFDAAVAVAPGEAEERGKVGFTLQTEGFQP